MFSLAFRDSAGVEQAYVRGIYALSFSSTGKGGPLSLTAAVPIDLISPRLHLIDGVSLYDGLDEIWLGRVCGLPTVTANRQAGIVVAEGYINHLADDSLVPAYIDGRLERWGSPEAYAIASDANASRFIRLACAPPASASRARASRSARRGSSSSPPSIASSLGSASTRVSTPSKT